MRVLILGGGLSGLFTAWSLRGEGAEVEVWEAEAEPGGWARTLDWPDLEGRPGRLERGPLALQVDRSGPMATLLAALGLELQAPPSGPSRWLGLPSGRHARPQGPAALLGFPGFSIGERLRWFGEPFRGPGPEQEDLEAFFARRVGPGFARVLLPAFVNGLLAEAPSRLDRDILPRLRRLDLAGGLLRAGLREGFPARRLLPQGMGDLARKLGEALGIQTGRRALALERAGQGWRIRDAAGGESSADRVMLALPPAAAAGLLRQACPEAADCFDRFPARGLRLLHSRHRPVPGLNRGLNWGFSLLMDPEAGRGFLGAVGFGPEDPRSLPGWIQVRTCLRAGEAPEAGLAALARWVPELGPALQLRVEEAPAALPAWAPGQAALRAELAALLPSSLDWTGAWRWGPGVRDLEAELRRP